jgi:hypothetical protein
MKIQSLIWAVIASAVMASNGYADLGDTYRTSCKRYGGPGTVDQVNKTMVWVERDLNPSAPAWYVTEQFRNNQCVAICYTSSVANSEILESAIWRQLSQNSTSAQVWYEYAKESGKRCFVTTDNKLYAMAWYNEAGYLKIRVAYKSWMNRNGVFSNDIQASELPPVEERVA